MVSKIGEEKAQEEARELREIEEVPNIYEPRSLLARFSPRKITGLIVTAYLIFGINWVLFSNNFFISRFSANPEFLAKVQNSKGFLFVSLTATLIYFLVYWSISIIMKANQELVSSYEQLGRVHEELLAKDQELSQQREDLRLKAFYDEMTGLYNRNSLVQELENVLLKSKSHEIKGFTLVLIDIDNFKYINDSLGYVMGDEFLRYISRNLKELIGPKDFLARTGGNEFAIILYDTTDKEEVLNFVQRVRESIDESWRGQGFEFHTSFSIGVTPCIPQASCNIEDIFKNTDMALHKAKQEGKNRYVFFNEEIRDKNLAKIDMVGAIKQAIKKEEFTIHYQPQFVLQTGEIFGVEALIRWQHPTKGNIPPLEFIPLAEEIGLIQDIELFVFHEAIGQLIAWDQAGYPPIKMSINLSSKSLMNVATFKQIEGIIDSYEIEKSRLTLEITETAIITDVQLAIQQLKKIRARGINIALDDFGTGFSSVTYLKDLPINIVKLDSSYSVSVDGESSDSFIVKSILQLSHKLGYAVVAEGIEEDSQRVQLREYGCIYGQGYLYSRPLPALEVERLFLVEKDS